MTANRKILSGLDLGNRAKIIGVVGGTATGEAVEFQQLSSLRTELKALIEGVKDKGSVRVRTQVDDGNIVITAFSGNNIDGVILSDQDLVLITEQDLPEENGIYVYSLADSLFLRADNANAYSELYGCSVRVMEGTDTNLTFYSTGMSEVGTIDVTPIYFIDTSTLVQIADASTTVRGLTRYATGSEVAGGVDNRSVTPASLSESIVTAVATPGGVGGIGGDIAGMYLINAYIADINVDTTSLVAGNTVILDSTASSATSNYWVLLVSQDTASENGFYHVPSTGTTTFYGLCGDDLGVAGNGTLIGTLIKPVNSSLFTGYYMVVGGDVPPTGFGTAALNIGYSGSISLPYFGYNYLLATSTGITKSDIDADTSSNWASIYSLVRYSSILGRLRLIRNNFVFATIPQEATLEQVSGAVSVDPTTLKGLFVNPTTLNDSIVNSINQLFSVTLVDEYIGDDVPSIFGNSISSVVEGDIVNGVTIANGKWYFIIGQTDLTANGVYICASGILSKIHDMTYTYIGNVYGVSSTAVNNAGSYYLQVGDISVFGIQSNQTALFATVTDEVTYTGGTTIPNTYAEQLRWNFIFNTYREAFLQDTVARLATTAGTLVANASQEATLAQMQNADKTDATTGIELFVNPSVLNDSIVNALDTNFDISFNQLLVSGNVDIGTTTIGSTSGGITFADGEHYLLVGQTNMTENGYYFMTGGALVFQWGFTADELYWGTIYKIASTDPAYANRFFMQVGDVAPLDPTTFFAKMFVEMTDNILSSEGINTNTHIYSEQLKYNFLWQKYRSAWIEQHNTDVNINIVDYLGQKFTISGNLDAVIDQPVNLTTAGNGTVVGGTTLVTGHGYLLLGQTNTAENGAYALEASTGKLGLLQAMTLGMIWNIDTTPYMLVGNTYQVDPTLNFSAMFVDIGGVVGANEGINSAGVFNIQEQIKYNLFYLQERAKYLETTLQGLSTSLSTNVQASVKGVSTTIGNGVDSVLSISTTFNPAGTIVQVFDTLDSNASVDVVFTLGTHTIAFDFNGIAPAANQYLVNVANILAL